MCMCVCCEYAWLVLLAAANDNLDGWMRCWCWMLLLLLIAIHVKGKLYGLMVCSYGILLTFSGIYRYIYIYVWIHRIVGDSLNRSRTRTRSHITSARYIHHPFEMTPENIKGMTTLSPERPSLFPPAKWLTIVSKCLWSAAIADTVGCGAHIFFGTFIFILIIFVENCSRWSLWKPQMCVNHIKYAE